MFDGDWGLFFYPIRRFILNAICGFADKTRSLNGKVLISIL